MDVVVDVWIVGEECVGGEFVMFVIENKFVVIGCDEFDGWIWKGFVVDGVVGCVFFLVVVDDGEFGGGVGFEV